jgi:uncharacterized RDD family membrane protein YckC
MYCSQCGQALTDDARFCPNCGAPLGTPATVAPVAPGPPAAAPPTTSAPLAGQPPLPSTASTHGSPPAGGYGPTLYPPPAAAPSPAAPPAAAVATSRTEYAGFWRRFWALFIDRIVLGIVLVPVGMAFGINMVWPFVEEHELTPERFIGILFGSLSMWLIRSFAEWVYFSAFQSSPRQATPGQMLLGVRVTTLEGARIGFARATGRYFASWLSYILLIGFIMGAFTTRKQTLHDMIVGTLVLRDRPESA